MINLIFVGTLHHDLRGSERIRHYLHERTVNRGLPLFIALEWAESTYNALRDLRDQFNDRIASEFPTIGPLLRSRLTNTLGYEGDFHTEARAIWMLNDWRQADTTLNHSLGQVAINVKLTDMHDWLFNRHIPRYRTMNDDELEAAITSAHLEESRRLSELNEPTDIQREVERSIASGRDRYMFGRLLIGIEGLNIKDRFGIVLIGAAHLLEIRGSIVQLVKAEHFPVECVWPHKQ